MALPTIEPRSFEIVGFLLILFSRNGDKSVEMLPFKKGAFHVAVNSNLPILPIGTNPSKFSLALTM